MRRSARLGDERLRRMVRGFGIDGKEADARGAQAAQQLDRRGKAALVAYPIASARCEFVRQFPIGPYIVDFACRSGHLAIELDGGQHHDAVDAPRTAIIEAHGYRVIRFWNNEVIGNLEGVLAAIVLELDLVR